MARKPKTEVQKATEVLKKALEEQYEARNSIKREGKEIIIPERMSFTDAAHTIMRYVHDMEEETEKRVVIKCHPLDGLVAFHEAMKEAFGLVLGAKQVVNSFFGTFTIPSQTYAVPIDFNETVNIPYGKIEIPGVAIEIEVNPHFMGENLMEDGAIVCEFKYQRKYEPLVEDIERITKAYLARTSIFQGKAIYSDLNFYDVNVDISKVVYSKQEQRSLNANLFTPIMRTEDCIRAGVQLKRTVLLYGRFGTGKTLTAVKAAILCKQYGWTFIYVRPGDSIEHALNNARKLEPCVVFFEDVDSVVGGERNDRVNAVLNTIDGFVSKSSKVITILTTNQIDVINSAMLRPGRIDALIELGNLDADTVAGLVNAYSNGMFEGEVDAERLFDVAKLFPPAFVARSVDMAISYALERKVEVDALRITNDDVEAALRELVPQYELMIRQRDRIVPPLDASLRAMVAEEVYSVLDDNDVIDYIKDN